jgi:hypothetical protein
MSNSYYDSHAVPYLEMAQVGWYNTKNKNDRNSKNSIFIYVIEEHGRPIKHFHFYRGRDRDYGGCIMLEKSMYFNHGNHIDTLSNKEILWLVTFLNSTDEESNLTNWQLILLFWNKENDTCKIKMDSKMPNYRDGIENYK